mmetsp:Transcript_67846/g.207886  ORF Transcript_67846/g.207886 Transcript_67846/m.207886 type:complete len:213 (+) Transcript_67846:118-756(+)
MLNPQIGRRGVVEEKLHRPRSVLPHAGRARVDVALAEVVPPGVVRRMPGVAPVKQEAVPELVVFNALLDRQIDQAPHPTPANNVVGFDGQGSVALPFFLRHLGPIEDQAKRVLCLCGLALLGGGRTLQALAKEKGRPFLRRALLVVAFAHRLGRPALRPLPRLGEIIGQCVAVVFPTQGRTGGELPKPQDRQLVGQPIPVYGQPRPLLIFRI